MTVEVAPFIGNFVTTYPEATADYSECDDHLRLIKAAVKASFPIATGAVTTTAASFNLLTDNLETVGAKLVQFSLSVANHNTRLAAIESTASQISLSVSSAVVRMAEIEAYFRGASQTVVTADRTCSVTYTNSSGMVMWVGLSLYLDFWNYYASVLVNGQKVGQIGPLPSYDPAASREEFSSYMLAPGDTIYVRRDSGAAGGITLTVWTERT